MNIYRVCWIIGLLVLILGMIFVNLAAWNISKWKKGVGFGAVFLTGVGSYVLYFQLFGCIRY